MTLLDKITTLGNSIIALNNTRADKNFSNITDTAKGVIQNYAGGAGIPKTTMNNTLLTNSLTTLSVSEANKRFCFANADASSFVYANDLAAPSALMNADGSTYAPTTTVYPYFKLESGVIKVQTSASASENAIRYSANDLFGVATVTTTGSVKYTYDSTDVTANISGTCSTTNVKGTKYIACGSTGKYVGKYTVANTAPSNPVSGDLWYDLSVPKLKVFTTAWTNFSGAIVGKMTRNGAGTLVIEKLAGYRMLDATTVLNEVTTAKLPVGTVISYMGTEEPEGFLLMDGREVRITDYPELYSVIGNSQGTPSQSGYFCIADMTDGRYLMGSTVAGGSRIGESLPNITGFFSVGINVAANTTGIFRATKGSGHTPGSSGSYNDQINMDFSRNYSTYQNNAKVRPESYRCMYYIAF